MRFQILLRALLKGYSLPNIRFLYRQYNNETNYGSSRLLHSNNNAFGMSAVLMRPTTQVGFVDLPNDGSNGVYSSFGSSVKDRLMWDKYNNISPRALDYGQQVSRIYHPSDFYNTTVDSFSDKGIRADFLLLLLLPIPLVLIFNLIF